MKTLEEKILACLQLATWTSGQLQTFHELTIQSYAHVEELQGVGAERWMQGETAFEVWPTHQARSGKACKTLEAAVDACLDWLIAHTEEEIVRDEQRSAEDAERAMKRRVVARGAATPMTKRNSIKMIHASTVRGAIRVLLSWAREADSRALAREESRTFFRAYASAYRAAARLLKGVRA
jgi:hypothetical protein